MLIQNDLTTTDYKILKLIQDTRPGIITDEDICKAFPGKGTYARLVKLQEETSCRKACIKHVAPLEQIPNNISYEDCKYCSSFFLTEYGQMLLSDWEDDRHDAFWFIDLKSSSAIVMSFLSLLIAFYSAVIK